MRPDVVNVCRWRDTSALPAFLAQRMPAQECRPSFLPRVAVAPLGGRASPLGSPLVPRGLQPGIALLALLLMPPAVPNAQRHWRMAAWVSANMEKRHKRIQANSRANQPGIKNNPVILESSGLRFSRVQKGWPSATPKYETGVFRLLIFHSLRLILFEINSFISGVKIEDVLEHHARASSLLTKTMPV
ncbi:unknown [Sutterella sp. CAG:351]|nr:unknown [Sutterella sp. CAG:351]